MEVAKNTLPLAYPNSISDSTSTVRTLIAGTTVGTAHLQEGILPVTERATAQVQMNPQRNPTRLVRKQSDLATPCPRLGSVVEHLLPTGGARSYDT